MLKSNLPIGKLCVSVAATVPVEVTERKKRLQNMIQELRRELRIT